MHALSPSPSCSRKTLLHSNKNRGDAWPVTTQRREGGRPRILSPDQPADQSWTTAITRVPEAHGRRERATHFTRTCRCLVSAR